MTTSVFLELTDERGRTAKADVHRSGRVLVRNQRLAAIVCWSLVVAQCWAYVARTRAVSLSACATEISGLSVRRVRGALRIYGATEWSYRAVARSGKAHAQRAVMLLARRSAARLPHDVWMRIATHLASMCEESEQIAPA